MSEQRPGRGLRDTSALALGSAANGVIAYVFFGVVTRALGAEAAAPVTVLWAYWSFTGAALTFPIQHWISRSVTVHRGEWAVRGALAGVALVVLGVALAAGLVSWLARDQLFRTDGVAFPLLVVLVTLCSGLMGVTRGTLTARRRFVVVGAGLAIETSLRCLAAVALIVAGVEDPVAYGACLLVGFLACFLWPSALRLDTRGEQTSSDSPLAFMSGASVAQLLGQTVLTGGPVLLAVAGGAPQQITALFAGLALFRAPYTLALGVVTQLTERLTLLVVQDRHDALLRFRGWVVVVTLGGAVLAAVFGAVAGPPLMALIFGEGVELDSELTLLLAVGNTFALANLVFTITMLARGRPAVLVRGWLIGALPGALLFLASGAAVLERTCWTFVVVEAAVFCWLLLEDVRSGSAGPVRSEEHR